MLQLKSKLTLLALLIGISAAFAFKAPARPKTLQLYAYNTTLGQWEQTPIDPNQEGTSWDCSGVSGVCTAYFSSKPALHQAPPAGYEVGVYATIP